MQGWNEWKGEMGEKWNTQKYEMMNMLKRCYFIWTMKSHWQNKHGAIVTSILKAEKVKRWNEWKSEIATKMK